MLTRFWPVLALFVTSAFPLAAQYPGGQTPYPPGPDGLPPGTGGVGIPRLHRHKDKQPDAKGPTISAEARTVSNDGKKLVAATKDGRTLTMAITTQTKFTRAGNDIDAGKIVPRTTIHVEAAEDDDANLTAVTVELLKDAPPETARAAVSAVPGTPDDDEMTRPTILKDPVDVPNRPVLKRGKPTNVTTQSDDSTTEANAKSTPSSVSTKNEAASTKAKDKDEPTDFIIGGETAAVKAPSSPSQELVEKTKNWAANFTAGLPNYVCSQMTTRYIERSRATGWEPLDVITAKVVYEDGKESYKEITVGGKRTNKSMMELGGSTSTGEFASTLRGLFSEASQAQFKLYETTTISGTTAKVYDFKVALQNSDWSINVGGQLLRPAYSGSVWIDPATATVRRIEMQADNIPKDFPLDSLEWAVDYDNVNLGTAAYLLPVHAENLACQRGTTICTKNTEDFRDYHKYSGESTIIYK